MHKTLASPGQPVAADKGLPPPLSGHAHHRHQFTPRDVDRFPLDDFDHPSPPSFPAFSLPIRWSARPLAPPSLRSPLVLSSQQLIQQGLLLLPRADLAIEPGLAQRSQQPPEEGARL